LWDYLTLDTAGFLSKRWENGFNRSPILVDLKQTLSSWWRQVYNLTINLFRYFWIKHTHTLLINKIKMIKIILTIYCTLMLLNMIRELYDNPWLTAQFYSDILRALLDRAYDSLKELRFLNYFTIICFPFPYFNFP